ncbi:hypothetical protein [Desulfobotulus sp.]|uniref:hypothetical protein n=1 Tax=Desulfobotulus sp. TaxID=1940337 RepID=UPI002A36946B|nr:hypothetical protein [Desulfobotulus sp.]MDY0163732.1 hypothetical protein [Desulfobotulus sp.]
MGVCLLVAGFFVISAEAAPKWRVEDRAFHRKDRIWLEKDGDPETQWRRKDRQFFERDDRWRQVEDKNFMDADRAWMREEQSS